MGSLVRILGLIALPLLACNKGAGALNGSSSARSERTGAVNAPKVAVPTTEDKTTGAVTGSVQGKSSATQVVSAAPDTNIAGAAAYFPPGTIAVDQASVTIAPGSGLATDQVAAQLGMGQIASSGNPVTVGSNIPETAAPYTLELPIPDSSNAQQLHLDDPYANMVVIYHIRKNGADFTGIIARQQIDIVKGFAQISTTFFGTFQCVITVTPVAAKEIAAAPVFTTAPVVPGLSFVPRAYYVKGAAAATFGNDAPQEAGGFQGFAMWASPAHVAVKGQSLVVQPASTSKPGD